MFEEYDDISPWLYCDMMSKESFDLMQRSIEFFKSHFVGGEMVSEDENGEEVCDHPACELVVISVTFGERREVSVDCRCAMCCEELVVSGELW